MNTAICPPARQPQGAQEGIAQSDVRGFCPPAGSPVGADRTNHLPTPDERILEELTPAELGLLTAAADDGMIAFPQGPARVAEQTLLRLKHLIQLGRVRYTRKQNWYRAWWLTRKGRRLVEALQRFPRRAVPAISGWH